MTRTFYPIGQGAFYTEKHEGGINIVYDCGSKSAKNKVDVKIKNAFQREVIDILFISHYDEDHVNKIHLLLESNTIKNVILPLLETPDKILLYNFYVSLGFHQVASLLNDPNDFFDDDTNVFFISPSGDDKVEDSFITLKELDNRTEPVLDNKIRIIINEFWEYIPYNHSYFERNQEFIDLLDKYNIDIDSLKEDVNYGLKNKNIIRKIYKEVSGNINENSLVVYSGPTVNVQSNFVLAPFYPHYWHHVLEKVSCIFTGDSNFNIINVKDVFSNKWDLVGTVQVPHHGSKKDFNENFLLGSRIICPISFGTENTFGHPNIKAIETIINNGCIPKLITENADTFYIQIIEYINS